MRHLKYMCGVLAPSNAPRARVLPKFGGLAAGKLAAQAAPGGRSAAKSADADSEPDGARRSICPCVLMLVETQPASAGFAARGPSRRKFIRQLANPRLLVEPRARGRNAHRWQRLACVMRLFLMIVLGVVSFGLQPQQLAHDAPEHVNKVSRATQELSYPGSWYGSSSTSWMVQATIGIWPQSASNACGVDTAIGMSNCNCSAQGRVERHARKER